MESLIKYLQKINDLEINASLENNFYINGKSPLLIFESGLNKILGNNFCYNYKKYKKDIYETILFEISDLLVDVDENIEARNFEIKQKDFLWKKNFFNKEKEYISFNENILTLIEREFDKNINKKNYRKKILELEKNIREFVVKKYDENFDIKETEKRGSIAFLENKMSKETKVLTIDEGNNLKIKKIKYNEDLMFFEMKENDKWVKPKNATEAVLYSRFCMESILKSKLKNNNSFANAIIEKFNNNRDMMGIYKLTESLIRNNVLLKNKKINVIDLLRDNDKSIEDVQDIFDCVEETHTVEKYIKNIISNKYKFLIEENGEKELAYTDINEGVFTLFKELQNSNVTDKDLQMYIGKKIASFKTQEDLKDALGRLLNIYNKFNKKDVLESIEGMNAEVKYDSDQYLILEINDYKTSNKIGSSSWCISRYESYFDNYTSKDRKQFFCYDFYKSSNDKHSMIGITIEKDKVYAAHFKNDDNARNTKEIENFVNIINNKNIKKNLKLR